MTSGGEAARQAVADDQARRAVQHDDVKANIEGDVNAEIAAQAAAGCWAAI